MRNLLHVHGLLQAVSPLYLTSYINICCHNHVMHIIKNLVQNGRQGCVVGVKTLLSTIFHLPYSYRFFIFIFIYLFLFSPHACRVISGQAMIIVPSHLILFRGCPHIDNTHHTSMATTYWPCCPFLLFEIKAPSLFFDLGRCDSHLKIVLLLPLAALAAVL